MPLHAVEAGPRPSPGSRTLVLLHGYGADERDLVPLGEELDPALSVVSLRGPLSLGGRMRAWFNLQQTRDGFLVDPEEVRRSGKVLDEALAGLAAARGPLIVLGFSQGACMAIRAAFAAPERFRALVSLSGVPPGLGADDGPPPAALRGKPAFAAHGTRDPLLPPIAGHEVRATLEGAGMDVTFREYAMGHQICSEEVSDLRAWLAPR